VPVKSLALYTVLRVVVFAAVLALLWRLRYQASRAAEDIDDDE